MFDLLMLKLDLFKSVNQNCFFEEPLSPATDWILFSLLENLNLEFVIFLMSVKGFYFGTFFWIFSVSIPSSISNEFFFSDITFFLMFCGDSVSNFYAFSLILGYLDILSFSFSLKGGDCIFEICCEFQLLFISL